MMRSLLQGRGLRFGKLFQPSEVEGFVLGRRAPDLQGADLPI